MPNSSVMVKVSIYTDSRTRQTACTGRHFKWNLIFFNIFSKCIKLHITRYNLVQENSLNVASVKYVTFLPRESIFIYYDAFNIYVCYFISTSVKSTSHFPLRIWFTHSISYNIGKVSVASKMNFIFKLQNVVSSDTLTFQHQVFCLSKYSTLLLLKKVLPIFVVCSTMLEHTIPIAYFTVESYDLKRV